MVVGGIGVVVVGGGGSSGGEEPEGASQGFCF